MITAKLKNELITHYNSLITKLVINESTEVTNFQAEVDGSLVTIQFAVPPGLKDIKRIRIYKNSEALSDCKLYVPINGDAIFKYKAEVIEIGN